MQTFRFADSITRNGQGCKGFARSCIWKPQHWAKISLKSGGVVAFGYPLATQKKKTPCKSETYKGFEVAGVGPEPTTSGL